MLSHEMTARITTMSTELAMATGRAPSRPMLGVSALADDYLRDAIEAKIVPYRASLAEVSDADADVLLAWLHGQTLIASIIARDDVHALIAEAHRFLAEGAVQTNPAHAMARFDLAATAASAVKFGIEATQHRVAKHAALNRAAAVN